MGAMIRLVMLGEGILYTNRSREIDDDVEGRS